MGRTKCIHSNARIGFAAHARRADMGKCETPHVHNRLYTCNRTGVIVDVCEKNILLVCTRTRVASTVGVNWVQSGIAVPQLDHEQPC